MLQKNYLQRGRNKVSITYINDYDYDQAGCIAYKDEGDLFVYTDFEPYLACRVFPSFDQPNLKTKIKLAIVTQKDSTAISN